MRLEIRCKIGLSGDRCLCTVLRTRSSACYYWIGVTFPCDDHFFHLFHKKTSVRIKTTKTILHTFKGPSSGTMQVYTSLQADNHTSTPPLSFLQAGCPSCRPANSVKALKAEALKALKVKGKVFPYSLPSVGPGADPSVQAVSPQMT